MDNNVEIKFGHDIEVRIKDFTVEAKIIRTIGNNACVFIAQDRIARADWNGSSWEINGNHIDLHGTIIT